MAVQQFADSPRNGAWGDRPYALFELTGPASYTQITVGVAPASPTGGQAVGPSNFGLSAGLEGIICVGCSTTGTYFVRLHQLTNYVSGMGNTTWAAQWIVAATGAEVAAAVNLSAETVRLLAFGPY